MECRTRAKNLGVLARTLTDNLPVVESKRANKLVSLLLPSEILSTRNALIFDDNTSDTSQSLEKDIRYVSNAL
jgi:hypothetical protein